ncbi:hypothetical protein NHX12_025382 [Muraenolepis orangiensis]|uniref:Phorbol-ester/DAG-type domain-containing protein n=1 Tax=Muraenolepis orangiensis TaxID=630683 RepID=A0A9Q0EL24_9TELE|nr:hypothetical protein NHX12_025382 [Muraenolepis orangiensis]
MQRLKRSLSFKSVMRSKSVDNFFHPLAYERSPSLSSSDSPDPSLSSCSPNTSPSATLTAKMGPALVLLRPVKTHCFQDHVFRKPTCCQRCKQMIQGNSKQGLRCKSCKLGAHLWCSSELSQQPCNGKTGAFRRNFSSPLLSSDALGMVREAPPIQEGCVDPVYEALRYGTSLAQLSLKPAVRANGKSRDRVGFFPANFVQRVRPGERVWKVTAGFHGNRDRGQMTVKEGQVCVGKVEEVDGFLRLSSGKKRGLVPVKYLLEI